METKVIFTSKQYGDTVDIYPDYETAIKKVNQQCKECEEGHLAVIHNNGNIITATCNGIEIARWEIRI